MKTQNTLENWLHTPRGRLLSHYERERLDQTLGSLFGRTLLQIGDWAPRLLGTAPHWRTGVLGESGDVDVICDATALPLPPNSIDAILLAHSLESASSAHRLLREVDQAMTARGQLLILGFNPFSWPALRQRLLPWTDTLPKSRRLLSRTRIYDWLRLLDYEVVECQRFGPGRASRLPLLSFFAPVYMIRARKLRLPVTPVQKPVWGRRAGGMANVRPASTRLSSGSNVVPFAPGADS